MRSPTRSRSGGSGWTRRRRVPGSHQAWRRMKPKPSSTTSRMRWRRRGRPLPLADQDAVDELFLAGRFAVHLEVVAVVWSSLDVHLAELGDVELASVALLEFVVVAHLACAGRAAAWATVAGTLVWTVDRHEGRARGGRCRASCSRGNRSSGARSG